MAQKVTNELILQRLEDTQGFLREQFNEFKSEIKTELKTQRKEWDEKYTTRILYCQECKTDVGARMHKIDTRLTAMEVKSGIFGTIGGFLGALLAGLINFFKGG